MFAAARVLVPFASTMLPIGSNWSTPVHEVAPQTVSAAVAAVIVATTL
jgi:hypothetical protein